MRKQHIILLGVIFGISLVGLVMLQANYFRQVAEIKRQQFVFTVYKSMDEMVDYIRGKEKAYRETESEQIVVEEGDNIRFVFSPEGDHSSYLLGESSFSLESRGIADGSVFIGSKTKEDNLKTSISRLQQAIREQLGKDYKMVIETRKENDGRLHASFLLPELQEVVEDRLTNNRVHEQVEFALRSKEEFILKSRKFSLLEDKYAFNKKIFPALGDDSPVLYLSFPAHSGNNALNLRMLLPGILIIAALVGCAVFCFVIIVRQKKLSTIKNDFINNMTHEFKTPLATISLASQMLKDGAVTNTQEGVAQIATIIRDESKRLTYLVERILQTALFTENRIKLKLKKVKINDIIADFLPKLAIRVNDRGGKIISMLEADDHEVMADEVHITNVLSNLVDNAIKYTVRVPEIEICTYNRDQYIIITVKDNGIGIAKKDQKLIFERFYRVSTGNLHDVKGFGLGLSYVRKIIEAHGGSIDVESSLEEGSCFNIVLPIITKKEK